MLETCSSIGITLEVNGPECSQQWDGVLWGEGRAVFQWQRISLFPSFEGNWEGFGWAVQQLYAPRRRGCDVMYLEYGDAGALHASLQSAAHQAATAKRGCLIRICPHRMEKPNPLPHAQCKGKCEHL